MNLIHLPVLTVWFRQLCPRRNSSKATLNSMFIRGYSSYYSTAASTNSFVLHPCVETTQGPMLLISLVFVHFFQQQILTYNFSQSTLKLGLLACSVVHEFVSTGRSSTISIRKSSLNCLLISPISSSLKMRCWISSFMERPSLGNERWIVNDSILSNTPQMKR